MRVFAGLPLPEEMIEKAVQVCEYLKEKYKGLNVVKSEGLHVTLYFFGELPKHTVDELVYIMDDSSLNQKKIEASFNGFGQFPPGGNPKVLYINIKRGKEDITSYYEKFAKLIRSHGFDASQEKEFVPHITIARNKRERLPRDFIKSIPFTLKDSFTIDRCILYQSILTPEGAEYSAIKTMMFS